MAGEFVRGHNRSALKFGPPNRGELGLGHSEIAAFQEARFGKRFSDRSFDEPRQIDATMITAGRQLG